MDFNFPDVGEGITEGKIVKWHVKENDPIKSDDTIASIETDKAVVDIPSPVSGIIKRVYYKEGETADVGKPLVSIDDTNKSSNDQPAEVAANETADRTQNAKTVASNNYSKATLNTLHNGVNNSSRPATNIIIQDGPVFAMPAVRRAARLKGIDISGIQGSGVHGQVVMSDIDGMQENQVQVMSKTVSFLGQQENNMHQARNTATWPVESFADILATPSTRLAARQMGIDLIKLKGTGDNGTITKSDLKNYISGTNLEPQQPNANPNTQLRADEIVAMSSARQAISKKMSESMHNAAQYSVFDDIDATSLVNARDRSKEAYEKIGIKLTYLPFIVKAAELALRKHPYLNASIDDEKKQITLKHYYNIGIATDTQEGLIVPVIADCGSKSIADIARSINDLASRARDRKLRIDEMSCGTFTISNLGNNFGQGFTPIINYPQVAILGVGRIAEKPLVISGKIEIRKVMTLSLTADHRLVDGAEASRFMNGLKTYLEDIESMTLEMR